MINCSNKQRKNIWKPRLPESWNNLEYRVYENSNGGLIFRGNTNSVDDFEVDVTDWIEQNWNKEGDEGAFPIPDDLYITVLDPDFIYGTVSGTFSYDKKPCDLLSIESADGVVTANVKGGVEEPYPLSLFADEVLIYPAYSVKILSSVRRPEAVGRTYVLDTSFTKESLDVESYNCSKFYEEGTSMISPPGSDEYEEVIVSNLKEYNYNDIMGFDLVNWSPKLISNEYPPISLDLWSHSIPLKDHSYLSDTFGHRFPIRMTKDSLEEVNYYYDYTQAINDSIDGEVQVVGYGYTVISRCELEYPGVGMSRNHIKTSLYMTNYGDVCPFMNLIFCNSDFKGKDEEGGDAYDIRVPLQVHNGVLRGKTINNITKTTWMNKYNDIHNSTATNSIELECYVEEEYLHTLTGNDKKYTQLMMVAQTARTTYLTGTAGISGLDMEDEMTCLKCRVKDVNKVETYSKYNQSHPVPSLKITIEIYR